MIGQEDETGSTDQATDRAADVKVERLLLDDGRQLLLYTWEAST